MKSLSNASVRGLVAPTAAGVLAGTLIFWLMAAALHSPTPHGLRVGLVAPDQAAASVSAALEQRQPGAFTTVRYDTSDEARAAVDDRSVAGAVVISTGTMQIMVASGDSEASAGAISGAFSSIATAMGATATVTDVHPLPSSDPHGIVPFFLALAISVSGLIYGVLTFLLAGPRGLPGQLASLGIFAVLDGLLAAAVVGYIVGFAASQWLLAVVCMLLAAAVAAATIVLQRLTGMAGAGLSALFVVILGMATSGGMVGPSFLADGFRELAGIFPPSAGLAAARGAMYFNGGGLVWPVAVLVTWIVVALALVIGIEIWANRRLGRQPAAS
jgi:hypothetical protein